MRKPAKKHASLPAPIPSRRSPSAFARVVTGGELVKLLTAIPHLGSEEAARFAADLDDARKKLGSTGDGPWE